MMLAVVCNALSRNVFYLGRAGPIPWYGSLVLWLSVAGFVYWYAAHSEQEAGAQDYF